MWRVGREGDGGTGASTWEHFEEWSFQRRDLVSVGIWRRTKICSRRVWITLIGMVGDGQLGSKDAVSVCIRTVWSVYVFGMVPDDKIFDTTRELGMHEQGCRMKSESEFVVVYK